MASARTRWIGLACLALGLAMIIVDTSIVNVAVPRIITDLKITPSAAEWVNSSYALIFAAALITLSRIGDIVGQRRLYMVGTSVFATASVLAALAPSGELLIGARLLQGLGGAAMAPSTQSIVNATFRGKDRAIAFAIYGSVIGGMAALGPVIGGWLTTNASWRWAFGVNLPIAIVAIVGTLLTVAETRTERTNKGFDFGGVILITLGLAGIVFGLIEGYTYGWWAPSTGFSSDAAWAWWPLASVSVVPVALALGAISLVAFALYERARLRAKNTVLIDFTLFSIPTFRYGNIAGSIVSLGEFGLLFAVPLFLAAVQRYSAFETGLCFVPLALGSFIAAPSAPALTKRFGARRVVTLGMAFEAIGIGAIGVLISPQSTGLQLLVPFLVYGIGVGFATAQLANVTLADVDIPRAGIASGTNSTTRQIGSALGIAIIGTTLFTLIGERSRSALEAIPELKAAPSTVIDGLVEAMKSSAGQALPGIAQSPMLASNPALAAKITDTLAQAFADAARGAGIVALIFVLFGLAASLALPKEKLAK
ncbi:MAG: DHA2 family efflux MFS transporter permease subunit [Chloroflexota bacterium]